MLSFGASERDVARIRVDDIDFVRGTVTLAPRGESGCNRVLPFVETCAGRCSKDVFTRYLDFRGILVKWVRLNNSCMVEPDELMVYEKGTELLPFKEASAAVAKKLQEIGRISGIHLTEGIVLSTYSRNRSYASEGGMDP